MASCGIRGSRRRFWACGRAQTYLWPSRVPVGMSGTKRHVQRADAIHVDGAAAVGPVGAFRTVLWPRSAWRRRSQAKRENAGPRAASADVLGTSVLSPCLRESTVDRMHYAVDLPPSSLGSRGALNKRQLASLPSTAALPSPAAAGARVPVLSVDDHPANLMALEATLEGPAYELARIDSGWRRFARSRSKSSRSCCLPRRSP